MDFGSVTDEQVVISDRLGALQTQENAERHTTAPYRAPELWDVASSCVIDGKVDVWAAGCVLYYMMVGETPFERISNQAGGSLMLSVLNGSYTWPEKLQVSGKYAAIVQACLTVDPAARPNICEVLRMIDGDTVVRTIATTVATTIAASTDFERPKINERRSLAPDTANNKAPCPPQPTAVQSVHPPPTSLGPGAVPNLIDL